MTSTTVWYQGEFCAAEDVKIPVTDRGFLLGDGIFDTMAAHDGALEHPEDHLDRLFENAAVMALPIPYKKDAFQDAAKQLLEGNALLTGHISLRTTITRGTGKRGLAPPQNPDPTILMTATAFDPKPFKSPAKLIIAKSVRRNEGSPLSLIKSLNYGDNILAKIEADKAGADDALMMNNKGHMTCGTNCNLFIVKNGQWMTPPITDGVLEGVTRKHIIKEHNAIEQSLSVGHLMAADEVYISNSIIGLRPVTQINDKVYNSL